MDEHDKDCEKYSEALRNLRASQFSELLFSLPPWDVTRHLYSYFGFALSHAPEEKLTEFFVLFESGVRGNIEHGREVLKALRPL